MTPAQRVARIREEIRGVAGQSGVSSKDLDFMNSAASRTALSEKQEKWLADIETRVFRSDDSA